MQVNKYIPHYLRIPQKLKLHEINILKEDYANNKFLQDFDKLLISTLFKDRAKKFHDRIDDSDSDIQESESYNMFFDDLKSIREYHRQKINE